MATRFHSISLAFFSILLSFLLPLSGGQDPFSSVTYHGGPLLSSPTVNIYIVWYGAFSLYDRTTVVDFFQSINTRNPKEPSVSTWWKATNNYKDRRGVSVSRNVHVAKQVGDIYSLGKALNRSQIADVVMGRMKAKKLPVDRNGVYLVLTSKDVKVERFCMSSCGFHDEFVVLGKRLVYGHVGNPAAQCPGMCAWPYAVPAYGPPGGPLVAPNGVGLDGMIINMATVIAGAATNPFKNGYYQGDQAAPLEAVSACTGVFGEGAYPGYAGELLLSSTNASFNCFGDNGKMFLVPAIWDLRTGTCQVVGKM